MKFKEYIKESHNPEVKAQLISDVINKFYMMEHEFKSCIKSGSYNEEVEDSIKMVNTGLRNLKAIARRP